MKVNKFGIFLVLSIFFGTSWNILKFSQVLMFQNENSISKSLQLIDQSHGKFLTNKNSHYYYI